MPRNVVCATSLHSRHVLERDALKEEVSVNREISSSSQNLAWLLGECRSSTMYTCRIGDLL